MGSWLASTTRRRESSSYTSPSQESGARSETACNGSSSVGCADSIAAASARRAAGTTCDARRWAASEWILASVKSKRTPRSCSPHNGPSAQSCSNAASRCSTTQSTPCTPTVASTNKLGPAPPGAKPRMRRACLASQPYLETRRRARVAGSAAGEMSDPSRSISSSNSSLRALATNQKRLCLLAVLPSAPGRASVRGVQPFTDSRCATAAGDTMSRSPKVPISSRSRCAQASMWSSPAPCTTHSLVSLSNSHRTSGSDRLNAGRASASFRAAPPAGAETARRATSDTAKFMEVSGRAAWSDDTVPARGSTFSSPSSAHTSPARAARSALGGAPAEKRSTRETRPRNGLRARSSDGGSTYTSCPAYTVPEKIRHTAACALEPSSGTLFDTYSTSGPAGSHAPTAELQRSSSTSTPVGGGQSAETRELCEVEGGGRWCVARLSSAGAAGRSAESSRRRSSLTSCSAMVSLSSFKPAPIFDKRSPISACATSPASACSSARGASTILPIRAAAPLPWLIARSALALAVACAVASPLAVALAA
mmetsp:Transcript_18495/g.30887  ORF Transcript_18495/g.30887 Transcript_18495/m.30887 type:complete len:539 (+) Transcript_18495:608-2224(+)